MKQNKKELLENVDIEQADLSQRQFEKCELVRVYAVDLEFTKISFKQAIIRQGYFRNCRFDNCDFTGADISSTNFQGSTFSGCTFNYTTFHRTRIGIEPIERNLPSWENLKMSFAKNLRMNYASIGDYEGVNFAIRIELTATMEHLKKVAFSREGYYRDKPEYKGLHRVLYGLKYFWFKALDYFWGNGERPWKMFISIPIVLLGIAGLCTLISGQGFGTVVSEVSSAFIFGGESEELGFTPSAVVNLFRLFVIGMFVSSLVRRLSRR